ncbi:unnamed protein product [Phaedon cochleariae]|uniref:Uncharacterized protein n=1 Tax=Phaedon cochleariae TaxID=80249 RepID=A0A9P0GNC2_PHACE|nr:unnamed protein product [Phaedon cochleariae]
MKYSISVVLIFTVLARDHVSGNEAEEALRKLESTVSQTLDRGRSDLDDSVNRVKQAAQTEYDKTLETLKSMQESALIGFEEIKKRALAAGVNIDGYPGVDRLRKLQSGVSMNLEGMLRCLDEQSSEATKLARNALDKILEETADVDSLREEVSKCSPTNLGCFVQPLLEMGRGSLHVPPNIMFTVIETVQTILSSITTNINECTKSAVTGMSSEVSNVLGDFDAFVAGKPKPR